MELHEIRPASKTKKRKRIGRGGKRGTYSGRGVKGQKARAGAKIRPAIRDIIKKFPKKRGYRFKSIKEKPVVLNLKIIERKFNEGETVNLKTLKAKQLIKKTERKVKILGEGLVTKKLVFENLEFSQSAQEKIKKAGGKIIQKRILGKLSKDRKIKTEAKKAKDEFSEEGKISKAVKKSRKKKKRSQSPKRRLLEKSPQEEANEGKNLEN